MQPFFTSKHARELIDVYGFALFPIHGIIDGHCTCGDPACKNAGKHPATPNGFKDATKDIEVLKGLWAGRKGLNCGIATGEPSAMFVIDIDGPEGADSISAMVEEHGPLPMTLTSRTARGRHLIFRHPGKPVRSRGAMLPKVDVRGEGGYIVAPHSNHITGAKYEFINPLEEIAQAPQWLIDLVVNEKPRQKANNGSLLPEHQPRKTILPLLDKWSGSDILKLLDHVDPDIDYHNWFQIGMAIKDYGLPFEVWDGWSRRGGKYDQSVMAAKWNSFKGFGVTIGTIVYLAKQGGWKPEKKPFEPSAILHSKPPSTTHFDPETGEILDPAPAVEPAVDPLAPATVKTFPWIPADDIRPVIDVADFVEGTLRDNEMSVIYGKPNCGKTFFMVDLSLHVAMGKQWNGREVEQGPVVYVSMEGSDGIKNRISAFKKHYHAKENIPLVVIPKGFSMVSEEALPVLLETLSVIQGRYGRIRLIVIDTLARAMSGGDENSTKDMGLFIACCDAVREHTRAHVSIIHHSGKDDSRGARGSTALLGGIDTEIELRRDDNSRIVTASITKQREMEIGKSLSYSLEIIPLGTDRRGKTVTSCIVMPVDEILVTESKTRARKMTPDQSFVLKCLQEVTIRNGLKRVVMSDMPPVISVRREELKNELSEMGFYADLPAEKAKDTFKNAINALKQKSVIGFTKDYFWAI